MMYLISNFIDSKVKAGDLYPNYYYEGRCPQTGELLRLPRTPMAEAIALGLMRELALDESYSREGKMYGILLVELPDGSQRVLKAFSGLLNGCSLVEGWVTPIPGGDEIALEEARTLAELDAIKRELIALKQMPEWQQYEMLSRQFEGQWQAHRDRHRESKRQRQQKRQILCETLAGEALTVALSQLDEESRQEGIERRHLKRQRDATLQPLKQVIEAASMRMRELKQRRKELSRQLQAQMQAAYSLTNFFGQPLSLPQWMPDGNCCAAKLLYYSAIHGLKPLAMAEFWWGTPSMNGERMPGKFYGACAEGCQPLMGFLLSGLSGSSRASFDNLSPELPIIYSDQWLIAVNKPAGLLSVPGRYRQTQDSVLSRLRQWLPDGKMLMAVHRLDLETSGILLLARDRKTYCKLSQQFQQRQVYKVYEAILSGTVSVERGVIELPLWGNPENRPYQQVDEKYGKLSITHFQAIARNKEYTRIEFVPLTGRTHQLRVHAADPRGLGIPILGDRLYGCNRNASRLHLHASVLRFQHPQSGQTLHLRSETPF